MEISMFFMVFTLFWRSSESVRCYKCEPEIAGDMSIGLCDKFDYSEIFVVECEHSTMCFKRENTLYLDGRLVTTQQRGCAAQTMDGDQKKINGKWTIVNPIHEVYEEGCTDVPGYGDRPGEKLDCYCRGNYCNSSHKMSTDFAMFVVALACLAIT